MTGYEYCIKNRVTHCPKCDRYYIGMVVFECPHCGKEVKEVEKEDILPDGIKAFNPFEEMQEVINDL